MKKCFIFLTIVALLLQPAIAGWGTSLAHAADSILYVDAGASGANDGSSWADAYTDLQAALLAAEADSEIWVAAGTYKPTPGADRTVSFALESGVGLYGGFNGSETERQQRDWETNLTTLSGDIGAAGDASDNSYHVVASNGVDATATLDGFTITAGNADLMSFPHFCGGGMYNSNSSPILMNLTFSGNTVTYYGGGMYNYGSSSPALWGVTFTGNTAEYGGGMSNDSSSPTLAQVTFSGNLATSGGGIYNYQSSPMLNEVTFTDNEGLSTGGGMSNEGYSNPILEKVIFYGNRAGGGGGMYNFYGSHPVLTEVIFVGNLANFDGGGMLNDQESNATLTDVTFAGNTAEYGGGIYNVLAISVTLTNAILWGNTPDQIFNDQCTPVVTYSDIQGDEVYAGGDEQPGDGNLNLDPLFMRNPSTGADGTWGTADDDYGDLRLQRTSPVIDAGNNSAVPAGVTADLLGCPRFVDIASVPDTGLGTPPIVDMGAYEVQNLLTRLPMVLRLK